MSGKFCFSIDRGGTFTDVYAICPNGKERSLKLLSVDPLNYNDAPREAIRRIIQEVRKHVISFHCTVSKSEIITDNIEVNSIQSFVVTLFQKLNGETCGDNSITANTCFHLVRIVI